MRNNCVSASRLCPQCTQGRSARATAPGRGLRPRRPWKAGRARRHTLPLGVRHSHTTTATTYAHTPPPSGTGGIHPPAGDSAHACAGASAPGARTPGRSRRTADRPSPRRAPTIVLIAGGAAASCAGALPPTGDWCAPPPLAEAPPLCPPHRREPASTPPQRGRSDEPRWRPGSLRCLRGSRQKKPARSTVLAGEGEAPMAPSAATSPSPLRGTQGRKGS